MYLRKPLKNGMRSSSITAMQILVLAVVSILAAAAVSGVIIFRGGSESEFGGRFCLSLGGKEQVRHYYDYPGGRSYVVVDCETDSHVWEGGLDKRSSLDSLQQAMFASSLTGKEPAIIIYDRDGEFGKYEYRISVAAEAAGVRFEIRR